MSDPFTKLFSSLVTSSVWREDDKTRIMWITMLALADEDGFVNGSTPGLAGIANMTLAEAGRAIKRLESPDKHSRTKSHDGRRIAPVDGGWLVINYRLYRNKARAEERKEYLRKYQREYMRDFRDVRQRMSNEGSTSVQPSASSSASASSEEKNARFVKPTAEEVSEYAKEIGFDLDGSKFTNYYQSKGWVVGRAPMKDWKAAVRTWKKNAEKFCDPKAIRPKAGVMSSPCTITPEGMKRILERD